MFKSGFAAFVSAIAFAALAPNSAMAARPGANWASAWAAPPEYAYPKTEFGGLTTREILHATAAGNQVRLRISNLYGGYPLVIRAAHIAVPTGPDTINPDTDTALSFGGSPSVTIPIGAEAVSDPATFALAANTNYAVSLYTPSTTGPATSHYYSSHYAFAAPGDQVSSATMSNDFNLGWSVFFASGLDVASSGQTNGIVAIGDSITDGYGSDFDTDTNWPDDLANLLTQKFGGGFAVADAGISGNALLVNYAGQNALARFDRDVMALPGVTQVIVAEGINDIGVAGENPLPTAGDMIAGLQQMINRAREKGLAIYGATLTPAGGSGYYNQVFDAKRRQINSFIRSGAFDGVLDFDAAIRDPLDPARINPLYDSGDHIHPDSRGYAVMATQYQLLKGGRTTR
jgi:lysophospholipase L1-like esterase